MPIVREASASNCSKANVPSTVCRPKTSAVCGCVRCGAARSGLSISARLLVVSRDPQRHRWASDKRPTAVSLPEPLGTPYQRAPHGHWRVDTGCRSAKVPLPVAVCHWVTLGMEKASFTLTFTDCDAGVGVGGIGLVSFVLATEFVGPNYRGAAGIGTMYFSVLGSVLIPPLAWLLPGLVRSPRSTPERDNYAYLPLCRTLALLLREVNCTIA